MRKQLWHPSLPFGQWPLRDQEAWLVAITPGAFLEEAGRGAAWADATKKTNIHHYGRWLAFLNDTGWLSDESLASRCTPERVVAYIAKLRKTCSSVTLTSSIRGLQATLWAMAPDVDWQWLRQTVNILKANQKPTRNKASRILPSGRIYATALREMSDLKRTGFIKRHALPHYRNALMLAITAAVPLRRRNLAALSLGKTIRQLDGIWLIDIPGTQTKNGDAVEAELPFSLAPYIETYQRIVHPNLLRGTVSDAFWINQDGKPMRDHAIYLRFIKTTTRLMGRPMPPHLLRDCAASTLAGISSDHIVIAQDLLTHRGGRTTEQYYIHGQQREASHKINEILSKKLKEQSSHVTD